MAIRLTDVDATPADRLWQEQADQLVTQGLPNIRATATAWSLTIGALASLFGLSLVVKGRGDLVALAPGTAIAVGVLSLIAIALAIGAIYLGALAAQGTPTKHWTSGQELQEYSLSQGPKAARQLNASRWITLASVVFLISSIGTDLYGPGAAPPLMIVSHQSGIACGTLIASGNTIVIKPVDGSKPEVRISSSDVQSATVVQRCP